MRKSSSLVSTTVVISVWRGEGARKRKEAAEKMKNEGSRGSSDWVPFFRFSFYAFAGLSVGPAKGALRDTCRIEQGIYFSFSQSLL